MRFDVRGTIYETVHEAAKATGRSIKTVYAAAANGTTDKLGTGIPRAYSPRPNQSGRVVNVAGVWFPSISALARVKGGTA